MTRSASTACRCHTTFAPASATGDAGQRHAAVVGHVQDAGVAARTWRASLAQYRGMASAAAALWRPVVVRP